MQGNDVLSHVSYTVLGLGSSDYSKYQGAPRALDAELARLGAKSFKERAEADEATNNDLVIRPWMKAAPPVIMDEFVRLSTIN
jgi:sulfite reductase alpha subunit-like flavoprotein